MVRHNEEGWYRSSETPVTTEIAMDEKFRWTTVAGIAVQYCVGSVSMSVE